MANQDKPEVEHGNPAHAPGTIAVKWNTDQLKSSYCNVCNANSTREEVVLNFGLNTAWDRVQTEMEIDLAHRIILSPHAAKRLNDVLTTLLNEYQERYGKLA